MKWRLIIGLIMLAASVVMLTIALPPGRQPDIYAAEGVTADVYEIERPIGDVRINYATVSDLVALPGIGPKLAWLIIEQRELHGPYSYPQDLITVNGIGAAKLRDIRNLLDLSR